MHHVKHASILFLSPVGQATVVAAVAAPIKIGSDFGSAGKLIYFAQHDSAVRCLQCSRTADVILRTK